MDQGLRAATTAALLLLTCAACTGGDSREAVADPTPLTTAVPQGSLLCDFVPEETASTVLGASDITADGQVARDSQDELTVAYCNIGYEDADLDAIKVQVEFLSGTLRPRFDEGLQSSDYQQLPESEGLGYSWTEQQETEDGTQTIGRAWLARGNHVVRVDVLPTEGRDPADDAIHLAQQSAAALDIPDEWTLDGPPPSR